MARVLIVDDDATIRQMVAMVLDDEGYAVDQASDGEHALEVIEDESPDVILLDMKMPGMDGWEFSRRYRERYDDRAPIIVFTAARDAAKRGADIGAETVLSKPFDLDELVQTVETVLRGIGSRSTSSFADADC